MSECVELSVYLNTDNGNPKQELAGVFRKFIPNIPITVEEGEGYPKTFRVVVFELALMEVIQELLQIRRHFLRNGRSVSITVSHGNVW